MVCVSYKAFAEKGHVNNYHILRASLSVCPARSAERTFQASLYTAPFPALSFGGADLTYSLFSPEQIRFQSAHPLRGATSSAYRQYRQYGISIHAPLAGCDAVDLHNRLVRRDFNPRTPCGVRQQKQTDFENRFRRLCNKTTNFATGTLQLQKTAGQIGL